MGALFPSTDVPIDVLMELCLLIFMRRGLGGETTLLCLGSEDALVFLGGVIALYTSAASTLTSYSSVSLAFVSAVGASDFGNKLVHVLLCCCGEWIMINLMSA